MKAYDLLDTPEKWTRGFAAVDVDGMRESSTSNRACQWCMAGAIWRCYAHNVVLERLALDALEHVIGRVIPEANDDPKTTFADVQRWLRQADV